MLEAKRPQDVHGALAIERALQIGLQRAAADDGDAGCKDPGKEARPCAGWSDTSALVTPSRSCSPPFADWNTAATTRPGSPRWKGRGSSFGRRWERSPRWRPRSREPGRAAGSGSAIPAGPLTDGPLSRMPTRMWTAGGGWR